MACYFNDGPQPWARQLIFSHLESSWTQRNTTRTFFLESRFGMVPSSLTRNGWKLSHIWPDVGFSLYHLL